MLNLWLTLLAQVASTQSLPAPPPCPVSSPSAQLTYHAEKLTKSGLPTDAGVEAPGFIQPPGETYVPGIGVSKYQPDADFRRAFDCGARFALVRLSAGTDPANEDAQFFKAHWRNAKGEGLLVAPYHSLTYASYFGRDDQKLAGRGEELRRAAVARAVAAAQNSTAQSALFLDRLRLLLASDARSRVGYVKGKLFLDPILDLSTDPWQLADAATRDLVAPVVRAAACSFVAQVEADPVLRIRRVILHTTPAIWRAYRLDSAGCDLARGGIALSMMTRDGGAIVEQPSMADICRPAGVMRCVMEHYTSFSTFLNFGRTRAAELVRYVGPEDSLEERLNAIG